MASSLLQLLGYVSKQSTVARKLRAYPGDANKKLLSTFAALYLTHARARILFVHARSASRKSDFL